MTEEERRRCCLLGGCGCTPGSPAQRAALEGWARENFHHGAVPEDPVEFEAYLKSVLDKLPWTPTADTAGGDSNVQTHAVNVATEAANEKDRTDTLHRNAEAAKAAQQANETRVAEDAAQAQTLKDQEPKPGIFSHHK